jgi:hypothetical protein
MSTSIPILNDTDFNSHKILDANIIAPKIDGDVTGDAIVLSTDPLDKVPTDTELMSEKAIKALFANIDGGVTTEITALVSAGAIVPQQIIPEGTTLDEFVKILLLTTFYPTLIEPIITLTSNQSSNVEAGSILDVLLTVNVNRGSIVGKLVTGVWQPNTFQDYRCGVVDSYNIEGLIQSGNTRTLTATQILDGVYTFNAWVYPTDGPQPIDSSGNNYSTPFSGVEFHPTTTITGRRKAFYGTGDTILLDSSKIRALAQSYLNPVDGTVLTLNIPIGAENVIFAYPANLGDVSSVLYVEGFNAPVTDNFVKTNINVTGANSYTAISYNVYTYTPAVPFNAIATYTITI